MQSEVGLSAGQFHALEASLLASPRRGGWGFDFLSYISGDRRKKTAEEDLRKDREIKPGEKGFVSGARISCVPHDVAALIAR